MSDAQRDFWPDIAVSEPVSAPLSLLKKQATALGRKTKGLLEGRVDTTTRLGDFVHSFKIVAPTLDDYSYELFRVVHDVLLYPARIDVSQGSGLEVRTERARGRRHVCVRR